MLQAGFIKCYREGLFSVTGRVHKVLQAGFIKVLGAGTPAAYTLPTL